MKLSNYIHHTFEGLLALSTVVAIGGCSDEQFTHSNDEPGTVYLVLNETSTRGSNYAHGTTEATDGERNVTDLRYFAFPVTVDGEENNATFKSGELKPPTPAELKAGISYPVKGLQPGKYYIYVVGNMPEAETCISETELKEVMIDHESKLSNNYKDNSGNLTLPMIYEPTGITTVSDVASSTIETPLSFACVKVSYRLLFDNETYQPYGSNGFIITKTKAKNLSKKTHLVLGGLGDEIDNYDMVCTDSYKDFGMPSYGNNWVENSTEGVDVITPAGISNNSQIQFGKKYIAYGTIYLPEAYGDASHRPVLYFDGYQVAGSTTSTVPSVPTSNKVDHTYQLTLGYAEEDGSDDRYVFPRSMHYELIATVKEKQAEELDAVVVLSTWTPHTMAGDLSHTVLDIEKTKAGITSLQADSISYITNRENISYGVVDKDDVSEAQNNLLKSLIEFGLVESEDGKKYLRYELNSAISYDNFGDGKIPYEGTVTTYIQAGNLRKYIDVTYNVSPLFEVAPKEYMIPWTNEADQEEGKLVHNFQYATNLGHLELKYVNNSGTHSITSDKRYKVDDNGNISQDDNGELKIEILKDDDKGSTGSIRVTVVGKPQNILTYNLLASPSMSGYSNFETALTVTVSPPAETYQIYFRAINDNQNVETFAENYVNATNNNSSFFFFNNGSNSWVDNDHSNVQYYIYTQMGQTIDGTIPASWVWLFTGKFGETETPIKTGGTTIETVSSVATPISMGSKQGWVLYELSEKAKGYCQEDIVNSTVNTNDYKTPKPGETLIIFNNNQPGGRHRMAFNLNPGIQLFDYEDKEGYYIFDPLCDPYYKVFDSRPVIEPVLYRIYSDKRITGWEIRYGELKDIDGKKQGEHKLAKSLSSTSKTVGSTTWYGAQFYAQAPAGLYAKSIKVIFEGGESSIIFNESNYYDPSNKGVAQGICEFGSSNKGTWRRGFIPDIFDSTTKRIWLTTTWSQPMIYVWKNGVPNSKLKAWPGDKMIKDAATGKFYFDVSKKDFNRCVIHNGSGTQSGDLTLPDNDDVEFTQSGNSVG